MTNIKKIISVFFIMTMFLSLEIQTPSHATQNPKKSAIQLNKKFAHNDSTNIDKAELYKKATIKSWEIALKRPNINNWEQTKYFCKKAVKAFQDSNRIKEAIAFEANAAKAHIQVAQAFASKYPTVENQLITAQYCLDAQKLCAKANDIKGINTINQIYQASMAKIDLINAKNAWQTALENPSFYNWINAEAFLEKIVKNCLDLGDSEKQIAKYRSLAAKAHDNVLKLKYTVSENQE